ncbi:MAG: hypothetical protein GX267_05765 [Fibrobacter sp.]|jgi:hypothetical protein|nr:hypothetical protein [Fibrobacter sp.]
MRISNKKWLFLKIALMLMFWGTPNLSAQNPTVSKNKNREDVIIEEVWKGYNWSNHKRRTLTYDSAGNCISELSEIWNGTKWEKESLIRSIYDDLHYKTGILIHKRNSKSSGWELVEGYRMMIDTIKGKSQKVVLHDAKWDPVKKCWFAPDSIFYDKKERVIKTVNIENYFSDETNDSIQIINTVENSYLNNNCWIETNKTWRSDNKKTESERYRYRKVGNSSPQEFTIDYWDNEMNRWIPNTAKLFRSVEGNQVKTDSLEEYFDDQLIPVYVSSQIHDSNGNLLLHRFWQKSLDEQTKKWSGKYWKWERNYNAHMKSYTVSESLFIADNSGKKWNLVSYENKLCKVPSSGDIIEWGKLEDISNVWQYEKYFDTLTVSGVFLNGELYYDEKMKKWVPTLRCNIKKETDSTVVTTELLDPGNNEWKNDSLFVVRTDSEGKTISRVNYVWTRSGLLNGNWVKASRMTYIR